VAAYLRLRGRLLGRLAREIGALRLLILLPFVFMSVGQALAVATKHPWWQWAVPVVVAWALLGAHGLQLLIGIAMVLKAFPLWLATAHTAGAALLLLATLALLRCLSTR